MLNQINSLITKRGRRVALFFDAALLSMVKSTIKFIVPQLVSEKTQGYPPGKKCYISKNEDGFTF